MGSIHYSTNMENVDSGLHIKNTVDVAEAKVHPNQESDNYVW